MVGAVASEAPLKAAFEPSGVLALESAAGALEDA